MKYDVTFVVLANYTTTVEASSKEEAIELARQDYEIADMSEFEFADELDIHTEII